MLDVYLDKDDNSLELLENVKALLDISVSDEMDTGFIMFIDPNIEKYVKDEEYVMIKTQYRDFSIGLKRSHNGNVYANAFSDHLIDVIIQKDPRMI